MNIDTNSIVFPQESPQTPGGESGGKTLAPPIDYDSITFAEGEAPKFSFMEKVQNAVTPDLLRRASFDPVKIAGQVGAELGKEKGKEDFDAIEWNPMKGIKNKSRDSQLLSQITGIDQADIENNYEPLKFAYNLIKPMGGPAQAGAEVGKRVDPVTAEGVVNALMTPVIVGAAIANPIGTAAGLAMFTALDHLIPTEMFIPKDEKGEFKDKSQAASIRLLGMIVKGAIVGGIHKKVSSKIKQVKQAKAEYKSGVRKEAIDLMSVYGKEKLKASGMEAEVVIKPAELVKLQEAKPVISQAQKDATVKRLEKQGKNVKNEVADIKRKLYENESIGKRDESLIRQAKEEVIAEIDALEAKNGKIRNRHQQVRYKLKQELSLTKNLGIDPQVIETAIKNNMSVKIPAEKLVEVGLKNESEFLGIQEVLAPAKKAEPKPTETVTVAPEGTKVVTKAVAVEKPVTRPKTDKAQTSGLAKSIEAKAVEQGLIEKGVADLAEFEGVKLKEQAKMGADLVNTGMDNLRATIRGEEPLPAGMTNFTAILAAEAHLKAKPNADLAFDLANSRLVTAVSEAASELASGQMRVQDSATFRLQKIKKHRIKKAETLTKETPQSVRNAIRKEAKKNNLTKKEQSWDKFLDEIKC